MKTVTLYRVWAVNYPEPASKTYYTMEGDAWRAFDLVRKGHLDRLTVSVSSVRQALVDTANGLLPIEGMHRMASVAGGDVFASIPGERVVTYFDEDGNVVAPAVDETPRQ